MLADAATRDACAARLGGAADPESKRCIEEALHRGSAASRKRCIEEALHRDGHEACVAIRLLGLGYRFGTLDSPTPELHERYRRAAWWTGETLASRIGDHVSQRPSATAVVDDDGVLTYAELWQAAGEAAAAIRGVTEGRRRIVLGVLPNDRGWMVSFLATLRAGCVPATAPLSTMSDHLRHIIELTNPALVVASGQHHDGDHLDTMRDAVNAARSNAVVAVSSGLSLELVEPRDCAVADESPGIDVPERTDHLMFTSSTTGPPKAVSHSDDSLGALNLQFAQRFDLHADTPIFMPSPLGHSVGAIHGARLSLYLGASLVLQSDWSAARALELVAEHRTEFTAAATPFLLDLVRFPWNGPEPKMAPLRTFLCGGAQVPPALIRQCRSELPRTFVTPLWGMTEGGLTTCLPATPHERVENTVGLGLPDLELRVIREGRASAQGPGELAMRGPGVFNGYYRQDELYRKSMTADGFFLTGDLATIDADGYVAITGRIKDLIIRGAVNISPVETENVLSAHPDIDAVAVIGWPDERLGERLCAVVETSAALGIDDITEFCERAGLARRLWPERLEIAERFPRTAAGKIRKLQLRAELIADRAGPVTGELASARSAT